MSDHDRWQEHNDAYLAAALAWLRLRLLRRAGDEPGHGPPATDEAVREAAAVMRDREAAGPPPALALLGERFGLSRFEREVLLLCAALELDTRVAALCARAQDDPHRPYPTFALALALFDDPAWDVLSPERPLRRWQLLEITQPGAQPLTASPLRADERIVNYLKGLNYLDDRLAPLLAPLDDADPEPPLPPSQRAVAEAAVRAVEGADGRERLPVLQLLGTDAAGKRLIAARAAAALGLHLYRLPAEALPATPGELESFARLWQRECVLLPIALYLDAHDLAPAEAQPVARLLARTDALVFLDARDPWPDLGPAAVALDVARPTPVEQRAAWAAALGPEAAERAAALAGQFDLGLPAIWRIARAARAATGDERPPRDRLWDACLAGTRPRLDALAQRLEPKATWEALVLPAEETALLRQLAAQVGGRGRVYDEWGFRQRMNRGLGISALFAGPSGTGKTMAAEVLANALRLDLYRIDLSAVVSKYIGETEKNLRRLFDAAEDGGAILFFDEADALFGKRSEVKDSHDRYANIEVNYLLQRIEAFRGLAILATNMRGALDQAFLRRLRFIVTFPFPARAERRRLWQTVFPPETPTAGLDFDWLARLNLTGGSIHAVALNAAFMAAGADPPVVTMPLVLEAARAEYRKLEQPLNEADFRWRAHAGVAA